MSEGEPQGVPDRSGGKKIETGRKGKGKKKKGFRLKGAAGSSKKEKKTNSMPIRLSSSQGLKKSNPEGQEAGLYSWGGGGRKNCRRGGGTGKTTESQKITTGHRQGKDHDEKNSRPLWGGGLNKRGLGFIGLSER